MQWAAGGQRPGGVWRGPAAAHGDLNQGSKCGWGRARARGWGLSTLTSVGPPPADGSYLNFRRPDNRPTEVKITSVGCLQPMEVE
jgi:hypothetical protein